MPNTAPRIFLSSTSRDLPKERKTAIDAIQKNYFCINMEHWGGSPYPPKDKIIEKLKQASAVVLILGFKYGSIMNDEEISYTEFEFNYAKEHGIDIYAFIKEDENRKEESDETEELKKNKFKKFKENIQNGRTVRYFTDTHELETEILNTLSENDDKIQKNKYFTNKFFDDKLQGSIADLGPRYNPKINVDLELDFFNVMTKNKTFKETFTEKFMSYYCELKRLKIPSDYQETIQKFLIKLKNEYYIIFKDITYDFGNLYSLIKNIEEVLVEISEKFNDDKEKRHEIDMVIYQSREHLDTLLGYSYKLLENPVLIVTGDAGCGKSHLLADLACSRMKNNEVSLLFLGNHFDSNENIGKQIVNELELDLTSQEFLERLNDKAKYQKSRILIIIDALNECKNTQLWNTRLERFINEIKQYEWLGLIVSIRNTYLDLIPKNVINKNNQYNHRNLENKTFEAVKTFCNAYNVNYPSFPPLNPIFSNPLFLKLLFENLEKSNINIIPQEALDFHTIINNFLENIEKTVKKSPSVPHGFNITEMFVNEVIKLKINNPKSELLYKDLFKIGTEISKELNITNFHILDVLIKEGLFYEDKINKETILKFSFEKIEDYLIADYLLEDIKKDKLSDEFKKDGKIYKVITEVDEINYYGIFEAFAVLVPEKFGIELFEIDLNDFNEKIKDELFNWFINSLYWRKPETIKDNVLKYIKSEIENSSNFTLFFESMILLSSNPDYILNAHKLHEILINNSMSERDSYWLPWIDIQYRLQYSVYRVVNWALSIKNTDDFDYKSLKLLTITLSWFLTSNNQKLRDNSTYAIINLLNDNPNVLLELLEYFEDVDDIYIVERLYAVAYGCILNYKNPNDIKSLSKYVYDEVFLNNKLKPNILLKDYCQSIINYSNSKLNLNFNIPETKFDYTLPNIPSENEMDILKKESYIKNRITGGFYIFSSMYEHARNIGTDEFEPKTEYWNYKISYKDLKNIIIKQTFELYDEKLHGHYDIKLEQDRYPFRANTYRIGEKYQRIAFYELLDILSINYKIQNPWTKERKHYLKGAWEIGARNFDPTLNLKDKRITAPKVSDLINFDISKEKWSESLEGIPKIKNLIIQKNIFDKNDDWFLLFGQLNLNDSKKINFKCQEPTKGLVLTIFGLIIKKEEKNEIIEKLKYEEISFIDPLHERQHQVFDKEFSWSYSYTNLKELKEFEKIGYLNSPPNNCIHSPFDENTWEFDNYLEEKFNKNLLKPSRLLFEKMNLKYGEKDNVLYSHGKEAIIDLSDTNNFEYRLIINEEELISFLDENDLDILWLVHGFKITYENGSHDYDKQLYIEGVYYLNKNNELTGDITYNHYNKHYVANKKTKKVHLKSCRHVKSLNKENAQEFTTLKDALQKGFEPCTKCLSSLK